MSDALPTVKIVVCGNGSVGKSSIIQRLVNNGFARVYKQTIGCDFFQKLITIKGDRRASLQVWDVGGQSVSSPNLPNYLNGSAAVIFCYDITDAQSLDDLNDWVRRVETIDLTKRPACYLVGNKIDLSSERMVSEAAHASWVAVKAFAGDFFVSARSGENVMKTFYIIAAKAVGVILTEYDIGFLDSVVVAEVTLGNAGVDEGRTSIADDIEREDAEAMAAAAKKAGSGGGCQCSVS